MCAPSESSLSDYRRVRILWPDHLGLVRGKYLPSRHAERGSGFCATTFGLLYDRSINHAPGAFLLEGLRDVHGTPDMSTLAPSWEDEHTAVAVADLTLDGEPFTVSSRHALQDAVSQWAALGWTVKIGIELEGYLINGAVDGQSTLDPKPYANPRSMVYGTGVLGDQSGFMVELLDLAERCGFDVESANVEFDEAQFEFTLAYDDAVRAVDHAMVFRVMAREFAISKGLDFTFMGKPFPNLSGSGVHLNFSLEDADGNNAFNDPTGDNHITDLARSCLAGLMTHHKGLTALCAPTTNAYRRLRPASLAGCWANWGVDHRNVTNRIPSEPGPAMRIEHRLGDGSMNLHLGAAALLHAARLGHINGLNPGDPYSGDGFEDGGEGVERSATNLGDALDDLEADTALVAEFAADIIGNFVEIKRQEVAQFEAAGANLDSDELSDFEVANYLPYH